MTTVKTINRDVESIRKKVRRLVASPSVNELSNPDLDEYINAAYLDMPDDIKSGFFKEVVEIYTKPNVDRYALSGKLDNNTGPNTYQSVREPVYVEGRRASFYKDRGQFYNAWPLEKSLDTSLVGTGAQTSFSLNIGTPILQRELNIGVSIGSTYKNFEDDGDLSGSGTGNIIPAGGGTSIGTVVYATGLITLNFTTAPNASAIISVWYYTYTAGRPYSVMYWKDELVVRPVPDKGYKITVEAFKYPTQFKDTSNSPTLKAWWEWIALACAVKILGDRQDIEGLQNIDPLFRRQEKLVRNRIACEQIGQRNVTIYEGNQAGSAYPYFWGAF